MGNFDILYPPDNRPSEKYIEKDFEKIKEIVEGTRDIKYTSSCITWVSTHQGFDFWKDVFDGKNKEEAMDILRMVVGVGFYNEDDIWE